ncbi:MAP/microtubule affinity-regulating kinase 3, partial [Galemys pyrenaicus]
MKYASEGEVFGCTWKNKGKRRARPQSSFRARNVMARSGHWSLVVILCTLDSKLHPMDGQNLQELEEQVLGREYRIPFDISTDCEHFLQCILMLNLIKQGTLEQRMEDRRIAQDIRMVNHLCKGASLSQKPRRFSDHAGSAIPSVVAYSKRNQASTIDSDLKEDRIPSRESSSSAAGGNCCNQSHVPECKLSQKERPWALGNLTPWKMRLGQSPRLSSNGVPCERLPGVSTAFRNIAFKIT